MLAILCAKLVFPDPLGPPATTVRKYLKNSNTYEKKSKLLKANTIKLQEINSPNAIFLSAGLANSEFRI
jgi:hypothetical protein